MSRPPCAWSLIRESPVYRREAFAAGLRARGYQLLHGRPDVETVQPGDVLLIWNRYAEYHELATRFERLGGYVMVAENGYVGNDRSNRQVYAVARDAHNGAGFWMIGGPERWQQLNVPLHPWRERGDHVVVAANRSFGMPGFIMPPMWLEQTVEAVKRYTKRRVVARAHPGNGAAARPFAADLENAWAVVIWSSSVGCEALLAGVPVICLAPWWIAKGATSDDLSRVDDPPLPDRLPAFERLAWAQWHIKEIEQGEPFQYLCDRSQTLDGSV